MISNASNLIQIVYLLTASLIACLTWVFSLKQSIAVLEKTVDINKKHQDSINSTNDKRFEQIDAKLDRILELIVKK